MNRRKIQQFWDIPTVKAFYSAYAAAGAFPVGGMFGVFASRRMERAFADVL